MKAPNLLTLSLSKGEEIERKALSHVEHMDERHEEAEGSGGQDVVSCLCRCGRAPRRKGQRNCRLCHAEANRRYRASLKKQNEALKRIKAQMDAKG